MFQSLSSFLPSALQLGAEKSSPQPDPPIQEYPQVTQSQDPQSQNMLAAVDEHGVKKKKERTNESFIVVRPPPAKSNHPLNLQVQLVPPSTKDRPSSPQSSESIAEAEVYQSPLARTSSTRSDNSTFSTYSSAASVASSSSTSSGRRMIIPLYNLQAHNVMQNVIVDAGTDAKIAKLLKRGLEIINLALLEPIEVWGAGSGADQPLSVQELAAEPAHTPTSSAISLTSDNTHEHAQYASIPASASMPIAGTPYLAPPMPERPGSRKFFGKLFKKKDLSAVLPSLPSTPLSPAFHTKFAGQPPSSPAASSSGLSESLSGRSKRGSLLLSDRDREREREREREKEPILQPPVLGIQPALISATFPPKGRPTKYVWIVRRWLKGIPESLLGGVRDKLQEVRLGAGVSVAGTGIEQMVEVRFEWVRGRSARRGRGGARGERNGAGSRSRDGERTRNKRHSLAVSSATPSTASLQHQPVSPQSPAKKPTGSPAAVRRSLDSHRSASPARASILTSTTSTGERDGDDGDSSDPEDSETPWTCTLVVRRLGPAPSSHLPASPSPPSSAPQQQGQARDGTLRIKVAAVVPTPHHPKVVALLKVPFPLPDIEVEHVSARKRVVSAAGVARPTLPSATSPTLFSPGPPIASSYSPSKASGGIGKAFSGWNNGGNGHGGGGPGKENEGLILTAEEIKDVVSCTGLWLVVREAFGGVGRVSRKGDGWRLRG
ncbi:hypothetical protein AcV5_010332 [Taiwanofungus camphoratus]|nr:hypothetical protein AcV5_010332 [Antrodia cinnamomea]